MSLIYQDKLEPGERQLEFIVTGKDEVNIIGKIKHNTKPKKRQYGLEAYGIPKENQRIL